MCQLSEPVHVVYHGPNDMAMPVSVPNAWVVKCTLRHQRNVLHVLLWICEPGCAACGNGYIFHRSGTAEPDRTVRRHCVPKYTSYQHKTEEFRRDALQKEVSDKQEKMQRYLADQAAKLAASIAYRVAENDIRTRRAPCASHPQPTHYTPASAQLQAEIRTDWSEYFTDDNFRMF
ncbi:BQ2448_4106 [Microbotryum intermedium]|uniref:BQ2448_4106 protein n=1 Tax=Microbotryum intermedium TaxID=269621 RepID=A0A238FIF3_9BASI|nr:BQ2448_4106 [Microbotryum intermedium]